MKKRFLNIGLAILGPLGVAGGLIYKIRQGEVADPLFYMLLVIIPSTLIAAISQITAVLPPDRVIVNFKDNIRAKNWEQASSWDHKHTRKVTSLYIPLRFENQDPEKDVILYDVEIKNKITQTLLNPPQKVEISVGQEQKWYFLACDYGREEIFNSGKTTIPPASGPKNLAIMIQENDTHRDSYELEINFKDNYGRHYSLPLLEIRVKDSSWKTETTEWKT